MKAISLSEKKYYMKIAFDAVFKASRVLNRYQKKLETLKLSYKDAQGLSSEADLKSEETIIKTLKKEFKEHSFLAEESFYLQKQSSFGQFQKGFVWVIDPLDGTNNYLSGFPYYAISVALCKDGQPLLGLVYDPVHDECFSAIRGQGAYLSHLSVTGRPRKLRPITKKKNLDQCLLASGFALSERGHYDGHEFANFKNVYRRSRAVRRLGAAALELCYVACGRLDGFWEKGLYPWDVAAAGLICHEVKLKVVDFNGRPFDPFERTIMAVNRSVYRQISPLVQK